MNTSKALSRFAFLLLLGAWPAGGCRKSQPGGASPVAAGKGAVTYRFSGADSKITFAGTQRTGKLQGSLAKFTGVIVVVDQIPDRGSLNVVMDMTSLRMDDPALTDGLKSADFLAVEKFPRARFVSTAVTPGGELGATNTVAGNLELHGVTRSVAVPSTLHVRPNEVDVDAQVTINRRDFGVVHPGPPADPIQDDVVLNLEIHATR